MKMLIRVLPLILIGSGCARNWMPAAKSVPDPPYPTHAPRELKVGAARVDVTPPPGPALFGHGPDGRVSDGYWSRLYCRAFTFVPEGEGATFPLAFVACDLAAMSTLLQRSVVKLLIREHKLDSYDATRVMIAATHTHAGPAHYFNGEFYGDLMSSRRPGFDPHMLDFLAERIANAIGEAHTHARPARLAWSHRTLWGLTRNRSLQAFLANDPLFRPCEAPGQQSACAKLSPEQRAIDPSLDVLRIDARDGTPGSPQPIGAIAFYASHPTVLPASNHLFHGDMFAVASRVVEAQMRQLGQGSRGENRDPDPLAAIVNTNEGDMSPVWSVGSLDETVDLGAKLGKSIWQAVNRTDVYGPAGNPSSVILDHRYIEVDLPNAEVPGHGRLCAQPQLGVSMAQGGSDHHSSLTFIDEFRDGNLDENPSEPCQKPKRELLGFLQSSLINFGALANGSKAFPARVPLAVSQIGDTLIGYVPAEVTVSVGRDIKSSMRAVASARKLNATHAVVAGLSNGYMEYVTTANEYQLQHYVGASNLYGPWTALFLQNTLDVLTDALKSTGPYGASGPAIGLATAFEYGTGPERTRLRENEGDLRQPDPREIGLCHLPVQPPQEPALCFWWVDGSPGQVELNTAVSKERKGKPWIAVRVKDGQAVKFCGNWLLSHDEAHDSNGTQPRCEVMLLDDTGLDFVTRVQHRAANGYKWSTVLQPRDTTWWELAGRYGNATVFELDVGGRIPIDFTIQDAMQDTGHSKACTFEESRMCRGEF